MLSGGRTVSRQRLAVGYLLHEECLPLFDISRETFFNGFLDSALDLFSLLFALDFGLLLR